MGSSRTNVTERVARILAEADIVSGLVVGYTHAKLAELVYDADKPTRAQLSAVRRSTAHLVAEGHAERTGERRDPYGASRLQMDVPIGRHVRRRYTRDGKARRYRYANPGGKIVRRAPTAEDIAARDRWSAEHQAEILELHALLTGRSLRTVAAAGGVTTSGTDLPSAARTA